MANQILRPSSRFLRKQIFIISLITAAIMIFAVVVGGLISLDGGPAGVFTGVFLALAAGFWIVGATLAGPYFRSLRYEIQDDEVIVHVGIWTKSVKHVPYRTVTNIKIQRGILDRFLFNIGTLNIQTAGMSGSTGAEESLVGLEDVQGIYEVVATRLREFRGGMSPTMSEAEDPASEAQGGTLTKILDEVSRIRRAIAEEPD